MNNFVRLSLETHLFFARIMKEHALFLEAGFPGQNADWIQTADAFKCHFENLLCETVRIANSNVGSCILQSGELITQFTADAERHTERLSGIAIDTSITMLERELTSDCDMRDNSNMFRMVRQLNERALELLDGLIEFKESILNEVGSCRLFTANYPLLIKHILREAKLYRATVRSIMSNRNISYNNLCETEEFWNRIMMEHALFIRGLLDPCEEDLIKAADNFANDYRELLDTAKMRNFRADELTRKSLAKTMEYRDFKAAGTDGILHCKIDSIMLPLLADHVLREANHYIRLLDCCQG